MIINSRVCAATIPPRLRSGWQNRFQVMKKAAVIALDLSALEFDFVSFECTPNFFVVLFHQQGDHP